MAAGNIPHRVMTTMDGVVTHTWTVGVSGSATGLKTSLLHGTEGHAVVSGTSPGRVYLGLPKEYSYMECLGYTAQLSCGSTSSLAFGGTNQNTKERYTILPLSFVQTTGNPTVGVISGVYANPGTQTDANAIDYNGRSYFPVEIYKHQQVSGTFTGPAPISATLADPIDASVSYGSPTARVTFTATFRNRSR